MIDSEYILDIQNLRKFYPITSHFLKIVTGHVKALDGITIQIKKGETLGIVGESGCGKSTLGKAIMRLETPTSGSIAYNHNGSLRELTSLSHSELFSFRKHIQMVFQDPYSALNPQKTIKEAFDEPLRIHGMKDGNERLETITRLMKRVNMPVEYLDRYPHEFSGGQRQRICIARALCVNPKVLICDEPVSALDVSIQAQILNLMKDIQEDSQLTYIFIAHDFGVVQLMSDRIAVMYLGKIVEMTDSKTLYKSPLHPYTQALLSAIPIPNINKKKQRIVLEGDVPSPINKPTGCSFHTRCKFCMEKCRNEEPVLTESQGHWLACHLY